MSTPNGELKMEPSPTFLVEKALPLKLAPMQELSPYFFLYLNVKFYVSISILIFNFKFLFNDNFFYLIQTFKVQQLK